MTTLRAGVIGVGYLGNFHAQKYNLLPNTELIAIADADADTARNRSAELGCDVYHDYHDLIDKIDIVSIAVPTDLHYQVARDCLVAGKHILLEKPITQTVAEAEELIAIAHDKGLVFQVGHLERFNPAVMALKDELSNPLFIESHRLAPFKVRGTDVNVIMDLMIHDIDIILSLVPGEVTHVSAVGVPVLSSGVDIANARLEFSSGCVANVTASRVSREPVRKIRIFEHDTYVSIDYNERGIAVYRKQDDSVDEQGFPKISSNIQRFEQADTLLSEIKAFVNSVENHLPATVSGEDGKRALEIVMKINTCIGAR